MIYFAVDNHGSNDDYVPDDTKNIKDEHTNDDDTKNEENCLDKKNKTNRTKKKKKTLNTKDYNAELNNNTKHNDKSIDNNSIDHTSTASPPQSKGSFHSWG